MIWIKLPKEVVADENVEDKVKLTECAVMVSDAGFKRDASMSRLHVHIVANN